MDEMNRRELLARAGSVGAAVGLGLAAAGSAAAASHGHEGHGAKEAKKQDERLTELVDEALDCKEAGAACVRHCISELGHGNTELAACLDSVLRMSGLVTATAQVAALDVEVSPRTRELAKLCASYCRDCRQECEKHAKHHELCKACMEACDECIEACEAVASA